MKQVVLGDIHGRTVWKDILNKEKDFDRVIFLADYFDTHHDITGEQQLNNFADICQFKKDNPDKVILLIGNHDYHYWPGVEESYTGYQPHMRSTFEYALDQNKKLLQMCFKDEYNTVYSHAGFTETFLEKKAGTRIPFDDKYINDIWKYKPLTFGFYPFDHSHCGDDIHQSCIWVRQPSLYKDSISELQVVGHTQVNKIDSPAKSERRGFYMIDCLQNRQYLVCIDGKFQIEQLPKPPEKKYILPDFYK